MMNKEFTNFIEITVICTIYINDNVYDSSATYFNYKKLQNDKLYTRAYVRVRTA